MRFVIDRCAGTFVADWLRTQGHDVVESRERDPDPGDRVLLEWAEKAAKVRAALESILIIENNPVVENFLTQKCGTAF